MQVPLAFVKTTIKAFEHLKQPEKTLREAPFPSALHSGLTGK
jgi:hypothetical protein